MDMTGRQLYDGHSTLMDTFASPVGVAHRHAQRQVAS